MSIKIGDTCFFSTCIISKRNFGGICIVQIDSDSKIETIDKFPKRVYYDATVLKNICLKWPDNSIKFTSNFYFIKSGEKCAALENELFASFEEAKKHFKKNMSFSSDGDIIRYIFE